MEIWKDINDYEGLYQISSYGRVKSLDRVVKRCDNKMRTFKERIRKQWIDNKGYKFIWLSKNGVVKCFIVHRLVAEAFLGYSNLTVNHKDENKTNNNIDNLEYLSNRDNIIYSIDKNKTSSKYINVYFCKRLKKWVVQKYINIKYIYFGLFKTEEEAYAIAQIVNNITTEEEAIKFKKELKIRRYKKGVKIEFNESFIK